MTDQPTHALQAGGHPEGLTIDPNDGRKIVKKAGKREADFYQSFAEQLDCASQDPEWSGWRPEFYGCIPAAPNDDNQMLITLENLIATSHDGAKTGAGVFVHPNMIDIKLGQRLYDDATHPEKIERMIRVARETTSAQFGVRLTGAQLWDNTKKEYLTIPKSFGKSLDPSGSNLVKSFYSFFPVCDLQVNSADGDPRLDCSVGALPIKFLRQVIDVSLIPQLKRVIDHVSSFQWRIYGSSLLFVFEGDVEAAKCILSSSRAHEVGLVKMIDFAHVWPAEDPDPGLLKGFQTTLQLFEQLSHELGRHCASEPNL